MNPAGHPTPPESTSPTPELHEEEPMLEPPVSLWDKVGGGSLTISLVIHGVVILLAFLIVWQITKEPAEKIEFLPGGGGGGKGSVAKLSERRKAASMSAPKVRIGASVASSISLPDIQTNMSDFSSLSAASAMGGGMGGGVGGIRGSGSGGMMGNGRGTGVGPGIGNGFVSIPMIFGQKIDARRMAVVLDMSSSMYKFLPIVIKEVDKVAPGSTVIVHYGCGLTDKEIPKPGVETTQDKDFASDRLVTSLEETKALSEKEKKELLELVRNRPKTFYVPSSGVGSTWIALVDNKLKDADAIYWFADFADNINADRLEEVKRKLRGRKQKLYLHPSNPKWLDPGDRLAENVALLEEEIVTPSGGKVINADVKKDQPVKGGGKGKPKA